MRRASATFAAVAAVLLLAGCGGRRVPPPQVAIAPPAVVDVSHLIDHECFSCLEQALATARSSNRVQAYEAATLLVLRAKELGIAPDTWLEAMEALAQVPAARATPTARER